MKSQLSSPCPCGRTNPKGAVFSLGQCCGRYLGESGVPAPDAQALMRSRYSAYALGDAAYLQATWHPSTREAGIELDPAIRWLGLQVRSHRVIDADHAQVEFVARCRPSASGPAVRMHECSRFVREDSRWFYVDGDAL